MWPGSKPPKRRKKTKFVRGQYIVITGGPKNDSDEFGEYFKENHIYRQEELSEFLVAHVEGSIGDPVVDVCYERYDNFNWRFATTEEVAIYLTIGENICVTGHNIDNYSII